VIIEKRAARGRFVRVNGSRESRMSAFLRAGKVLCVIAAGFAASLCAAASPVDAPDGDAVLTTTASGVQIYSCEYDANHRLDWVFKSPRATLYNASGEAVIEHSAGPSWEAKDGSRITGRVIAQIPGAASGSIAQLLLETHAAPDSPAYGALAGVRYVQRINTVGGVKPATACSVEHALGNSPYIANYIFFR
jgi:hypothetical protein